MATFNFVPFSDKILPYPKEWGGIPAQNKLDKSNKLKSGEIHITLTAETALYISNGKRGHDNDFFSLPDGTYAIPGSSLRGMIYLNMQILSYGLVRKDEDIKESVKKDGGAPYDRYYYEKGRPQSHRDTQWMNPNFLDFPHAVMGYVITPNKKNAGRKMSDKTDTMRSRVSFGNCKIVRKCGRMSRQYMNPSKPELDNNAFYSIGEAPISSNEFLLRGYKLYWLQENAALNDRNWNPQGSYNVTFVPMAPGTTFSGVIHYSNLHPEELGLLLWALRLDKDCYQSIGFGKANGMGRISLKIEQLVEYDFKQLYSSRGFIPEQPKQDIGVVDRYIECFDAYASKELGADGSIRSLPEIQDFFYMHSLHGEQPVSDTVLNDAGGRLLLTVAEIRANEHLLNEEQANNTDSDDELREPSDEEWNMLQAWIKARRNPGGKPSGENGSK